VISARRRVLCDWGSSRLRAFLEVDGTIVDRRAVDPWRTSGDFDPVVASGMVGSRNGVVEVPYMAAPVDSQVWADGSVVHRAGEFALTIAAGVRGINYLGAPDVMRGEENWRVVE
jgi:2-dehydro-3-deoxygalactonokinase